MTTLRPKLRRLDRHRLDRDGEALIVLRDPIGLADPVALPAEAGVILDLLDGERTAAQIRHTLLFRGGPRFDADEIEGLIEALAEAWLLDDDAFRERWAALHRDFIDAPLREPIYAGVLYPRDPAQLRGLWGALIGDPRVRRSSREEEALLGVVLPHQPFDQIGRILDLTLRRLPSPDSLDLIVLLGTDHHPGLTPFALTDKSYRTPLGVVQTDSSLVATLSERLPWVRREEIRHRQALSLELGATLIQALYPEARPPILPILCGQTAGVAGAGGEASDDFFAAMERELSGARVFWWTMAELCHAGLAYGRPPLTEDAADALTRHDHWLIEPLLCGRPDQLGRRLFAEDPVFGRASGGAALSTVARLLPVGYRGEMAWYEPFTPPGVERGLAGLVGLRLLAPGEAVR